MLSFPDIQQPAYPLGNRLEDPSIQSKTENGYVVSRPRYTRIRETFILKWNSLPANDYTKLRTFWQAVKGGSDIFQWVYPAVNGDPYSGKPFEVRFIGGDINFELVNYGQYSGSLTIQEA